MGSIDSATRRVVSDEQRDDEFRVLITGFGVHYKHSFPPESIIIRHISMRVVLTFRPGEVQ